MPNNERNLPHLIGPKGTLKTHIPFPGVPIQREDITRDNEAHANRLLDELNAAIAKRELLLTSTPEASQSGGSYLTFILDKSVALDALKSLDHQSKKIQLRTIQEIGEKVHALVFIPDDKENFFVEKVREFKESSSILGANSEKRPKRSSLVKPIDSISNVQENDSIEFENGLIVDENKAIWWEVWLEKGTEQDYRKRAQEVGLKLSAYTAEFAGLDVVLTYGTKLQIIKLKTIFGGVAEIRVAVETATDLLNLSAIDQKDYVKHIIERISTKEKADVFLCVLDYQISKVNPLIKPFIADEHFFDAIPSFTPLHPSPQQGHGTFIAGLCLFGDLTNKIHSVDQFEISYSLESSKLLPNKTITDLNYTELTHKAVCAPEEHNKDAKKRIFIIAVTQNSDCKYFDPRVHRLNGEPSLWSSKLDLLSFGDIDNLDSKRLFVVSAGNLTRTPPIDKDSWIDQNDVAPIESPAQAWNALTIGAYTEKVVLTDASYSGFQPLAGMGELSPFSRTSVLWDSKRPLKPDLVLEGGNLAVNTSGSIDAAPDLQLLTTSHIATSANFFDYVGGTSSATALAGQMLAVIAAKYPTYWVETLRGLLVHSATWTDAMQKQTRGTPSERKRILLRRYGFGVPNLATALGSATNDFTIIIEDSINPFNKDTTVKIQNLKLYKIPWQKILQPLGEVEVHLKVTLSYFVEPNPGKRGYIPKFMYQSHGLQFEIRRKNESEANFIARICGDTDTSSGLKRGSEDNIQWQIGESQRMRGSILSDTWKGTATELALRDSMAIYPTSGWWKERPSHHRYTATTRYSLIMSVTVIADTDIYTEIKNLLTVNTETLTPIPIAIEVL
jgi:hypothetical protein